MKRKCGECAMCCDLYSIAELNKAEDVRCTHSTGHRCTIYKDRPKVCVDFQCVWSQGNNIVPKWMRPDRVNVVITLTTSKGRDDVMHARMPVGATIDKRAFNWLMRVSHGMIVVVTQGDRRTMYRRGKQELQWSNRQLQAELKEVDGVQISNPV